MSTTSRVTDKGQTTIPKELRQKYGIEPGDTVIWDDTDDGIVIRKVIDDAGRGMWVADDLSSAEREAIARELEADIHDRRDTEWAVE
jgi:AbrB family looped-hinge helix DNA binding protein